MSTGSGASVTTSLSFFAGSDEPPVYVASRGGRDARLDVSGRFENKRVEIRDGRVAGERFELDIHGFELVDGLDEVPDYRSVAYVDAAYIDRVKALMLERTGARRVEVFDHTMRADDPDIRDGSGSREPTALLHNDYTARSAPRRLRELFPDEAETLIGGRFAIVNVWRPVNYPVQTKPLALCDARTLDDADLVACERRAHDRVGELMLVRFNINQEWFYFPGMRTDEALLIKTFDSARDGTARYSAHTAFDLPRRSGRVAPRQSIETRTFVFF